MKRNNCLVCGAALFQNPLLECRSMPKSAQHFPDGDHLDEDQPIDLCLKQCTGCGLVQLDVDAVDYFRDVIRSGGYSTTMHQLRHEQYERFMQMCPVKGKKIIEIGCGRGEFLRIWREDAFDADVYGIENDPELVEIALQDGLKVDRCFAENENTVLKNGPFDGFCSFNFLEHQPDPNGMLRCIRNNLNDEAYGLITVPTWEYIAAQESYYELIRDHIAYYSKDSLCFLLEKNGFSVLSIREINRDTWEAIVRKRPTENTDRIKENMEKLKNQLHSMADEMLKDNRKLAIWGASHQGLTILASTGIAEKVSCVIDSAPFKQGLYTIGSHIRIVSPDQAFADPPGAILIIAPGYTEEIRDIICKRTGGKVLVYALRSNQLEKIT